MSKTQEQNTDRYVYLKPHDYLKSGGEVSRDGGQTWRVWTEPSPYVPLDAIGRYPNLAPASFACTCEKHRGDNEVRRAVPFTFAHGTLTYAPICGACVVTLMREYENTIPPGHVLCKCGKHTHPDNFGHHEGHNAWLMYDDKSPERGKSIVAGVMSACWTNEPIIATVGLDDMTGDDIAADVESPALRYMTKR